jgi:hypothetical protein
MFETGGQAGKPLSPRTVRYARSILRRALNDAVTERVLEVNPVVGSKCPKSDGKPQHSTWTGEQVKVFLEHLGEDRWAPLWHLATATGMRRGELIGLRWADVDIDGAVVSVERSTTQVGRERVTSTPKNHERRKVAIDPAAVAALRSWRKVQAAERLAWGPAYVDAEGLVFTWEDGSPVLPDFVTKAFGRLQAVVATRLVEAELEALPRDHGPRDPPLPRDDPAQGRRAGAHRGQAPRPQGSERDAQRLRRRHPRRRHLRGRHLRKGGVGSMNPIYDLPDDANPETDIPPWLDVDTIIRHRAEILGYWDGERIRDMKILGIWDGENIIRDPSRDDDDDAR